MSAIDDDGERLEEADDWMYEPQPKECPRMSHTHYEVIYRDPRTGRVSIHYSRPLSDLSLAKQVEALNAKADIMGYDSPYRIRVGGKEFKSLVVD